MHTSPVGRGPPILRTAPILLLIAAVLTPGSCSERSPETDTNGSARRRHTVPDDLNDVERAMFRGARWLAEHQSRSGAWQGARFTEHCPAENPCPGTGFDTHDGALTALSVLAIMKSDVADTDRLIRVQKSALQWLRRHVNRDGTVRFRPETKRYFARSLTLLALLKADLRPDLGIRIDDETARRIKRNLSDDVREINIARAADRLPECVTPWFWAVLQQKPELSPRRPAPARRKLMNIVNHSFDAGWATTKAIRGIQNTFFYSSSPGAPGKRLVRDLPDALRARPASDLYASYFWLKAFNQASGKAVRNAMLNIQSRILEKQAGHGHKEGSWPATGRWGSEGGRIYSTAMSMMILAATPH